MRRVLFTIYSIVTVFCLLFGFPMMVVNIGKNTTLVIIYASVAALGVLLLVGYALLIMTRLKKINKRRSEDEKDESNH